jgi:hypothetical protein
MSRQQPHLPLAPAKADMMLARDLLDIEGQQAALRQHHQSQQHQERLARLFRLVGDSADERYLLDIMARYRGTLVP